MRRVIIDVRDGVASVVEQPADVEVVIRDYDCDGCNMDTLVTDDCDEYMRESVHTP